MNYKEDRKKVIYETSFTCPESGASEPIQYHVYGLEEVTPKSPESPDSYIILGVASTPDDAQKAATTKGWTDAVTGCQFYFQDVAGNKSITFSLPLGKLDLTKGRRLLLSLADHWEANINPKAMWPFEQQ